MSRTLSGDGDVRCRQNKAIDELRAYLKLKKHACGRKRKPSVSRHPSGRINYYKPKPGKVSVESILQKVATGDSITDIARSLHFEPQAISIKLSRYARKMGIAYKLPHLVAVAFRNGIIT